jgi:hypothetical protein
MTPPYFQVDNRSGCQGGMNEFCLTEGQYGTHAFFVIDVSL